MKKILLIIICLITVHSLQAQKRKPSQSPKTKAVKVEEKGKKVVGIYVGISLTSLLYEALDLDIATKKYAISTKPAIQGTFDYFINNKITIGFFFSVQPMMVDISHWQYDTLNPNKSIADVQAKLNRTYIGGKFLYHFKNTEKIDIYSGIRAGALFWNNRYPSTDPAFVSAFRYEFSMINRPAIGLIPIGVRIKFTPQIAANIEIGLSAPNLFAFGGSYMFD